MLWDRLKKNFWSSKQGRLLVFIILILLLLSLCFYYDTRSDYRYDYPSTGAIIKNYPQGETVYVAGVVEEAYDGGFCLKDNFKGKMIFFYVNSSVKIAPGDRVVVLGVLEDDYNIMPNKIALTTVGDYWFVIIRSLLGLTILILVFFRYWYFDLQKVQFMRRF